MMSGAWTFRRADSRESQSRMNERVEFLYISASCWMSHASPCTRGKLEADSRHMQ